MPSRSNAVSIDPVYGFCSNRTFPGAWDEFPGFATPAPFPSGVELLQQDHAVRAVHLIHGGMIKLQHLTRDGRGVIIGIRSRGYLLGAAEAIIDRASPITAVTSVHTIAAVMPADAFRDLFSAESGFRAGVSAALAEQAHQSTRYAIELGSFDAGDRLLHFLSEISCPAPGSEDRAIVRLPLVPAELAQLLAVTREHLHCLLARFEHEGLLKRAKGAIILLRGPQREYP